MKELKNRIKHRDWENVKKLSSSSLFKEDPQSLTSKYCNDCECFSSSLLSYSLRFSPPLYIVRIFATKYPRSVMNTDCQGRLPLHIAAENGAFPDVIKFLLELNGSLSAGVADKEGKTPLHLSMEGYFKTSKERFSSSTSYEIYRSFPEVVDILSKAAPFSVITEDIYDKCVLEYALEKCLDGAVLVKLQKVAQTVMKERYDKLYPEKISYEDMPEKRIDERERSFPSTKSLRSLMKIKNFGSLKNHFVVVNSRAA